MSPFKAVINDMYAKDVSKKIKSVFNTKRANGQFIGAFPPYGYQKDPKDNNKFIVDDEVGHIIKRIFNSYIAGESMCGIVKVLNNELVPCPTKYKGTNSTYKNAMIKRYLWTQETVKRILTNPVYMGDMAQHRQEKINYKLDKFRKIPPKDWIIAKDTHEPIVSQQDFELVQELIKKRIVHYARPEQAAHLLNGLLFCKDCGAKMTYRRNKAKKMNVLCMTYSKFGNKQCSNHLMSERAVESYVVDELKKIAAHTFGENFYNQFQDILPDKDNSREKEAELTNRKLTEVKNVIKQLYVDKLRGVIDEDMFLYMSGQYNEEKTRLNKRLAALSDAKERPTNEVNYIEVIKKLVNFDIVDRTILTKLINRIEISADKQIFITYNFKNPYEMRALEA